MIGCPDAWAACKGVIARERGEFDGAEELFDGPADRRGAGRPGDRELDPGQPSVLLAIRGDPDAASGSPANCELTDGWATSSRRPGRWSTSASCGWPPGTKRGRSTRSSAAERLYREAMGDGGEAEAWRAALRAEALGGVGRIEEGDGVRVGGHVAHERDALVTAAGTAWRWGGHAPTLGRDGAPAWLSTSGGCRGAGPARRLAPG